MLPMLPMLPMPLMPVLRSPTPPTPPTLLAQAADAHLPDEPCSLIDSMPRAGT